MRYPCPCCNHYTLSSPPGSYDICPVCFWEDDNSQNENPNYTYGANSISLHDAKENYKKFGAIQESSLIYVRLPYKNEKK